MQMTEGAVVEKESLNVIVDKTFFPEHSHDTKEMPDKPNGKKEKTPRNGGAAPLHGT